MHAASDLLRSAQGNMLPCQGKVKALKDRCFPLSFLHQQRQCLETEAENLPSAETISDRLSTMPTGSAQPSMDMHCNPLFSAAKMKEVRREQALARVTKMLSAHFAASNGSAKKDLQSAADNLGESLEDTA